MSRQFSAKVQAMFARAANAAPELTTEQIATLTGLLPQIDAAVAPPRTPTGRSVSVHESRRAA